MIHMNTITLPKKEYKNLVKRQYRVEKELATLREVVRDEIEEKRIRPSVLKRWDKISRDLDKGKGRTFTSLSSMRKWLKSV